MKNEPEETDEIESEDGESTADPAAQEVAETLPAYREYQKERQNETDGLTFGDY